MHPFADLDWNFDNVPDGELAACCYWEYARESAFIRNTLQVYRDNWRCPSGKPGEWILKNDRRLEKIQSIGHAADVFVCGCSFEPDRVWQSDDPAKPNYQHPDAPPISGNFPAPWQSLPEGERKYRAHIHTDVEKLQIAPIRLSHWAWAKEIARETQRVADDRQEQRRAWERKYLAKDAKGNVCMVAGAPGAPDFEPIRPCARWGVGETLMVDIAWDSFTNDDLATYFRQWLKIARPKNLCAPSGQGHKPKDRRANLTRLAAMRLLGRFTPLEIIDPRRNKFPAVWETKQFAGRKWGDPTKWHDARREAGQLFHKLFPFLPPDEKPLSWERPSPVK